MAVFNTSTDGVASEVQWNLSVTRSYLDAKENYISLPDTNHNVKNSRYQLIGGSSAASIGSYVFDPWMLKDAGIAQELWRVDDFASDALPMILASSNSLVAMINGNYEDVGNCAVTTASLTFTRLHLYAVNSRKTNGILHMGLSVVVYIIPHFWKHNDDKQEKYGVGNSWCDVPCQ